jgi:uncharacterized protein
MNPSQRIASLLIALFAAQLAPAQDLAPTGAGDIPATFEPNTDAYDYTRQEAMIPMRDGVKLFTVILIPKNIQQPAPIVMARTPYNASKRTAANEGASPRMSMGVRSAVDNDPLIRNGYIVVMQDVRGKYKSEGTYIVNLPLRGPLNSGKVDHATDTWDTIDWLVKNVPGNNGRVGITGISYDGFLTLMALFDPHPALKAAIPINAMVDSWIGDDWYHNGALRQTMIEWIYGQTSTKADDLQLAIGYRDLYPAFLEAGTASEFGKRHNADKLPAWRRIIDNPAYTPLWQQQAVQTLLQSIDGKVPVMTVHSLFDQEDIFGPLASYAALEQKDAGNERNFLVIGPWFHGQSAGNGAMFGKLTWNSDTSRHFREKIRMAFWDEHLRDRRPAKRLPPVIAFETGANEWREYQQWPPRGKATSAKLYLQPQGRLKLDAPPAARESFTQYVSDPAKPVPYRVRPILSSAASATTWRTWLSDDQRPVADRTDVINFVSDVLTESVTLSGEVIAHLLASTTGSDADWVVKLIDLYPDEHPVEPDMAGYQFMVSADIFRGRYREGFATAKPIASGKVLPYRISLPQVNHTFLPGHRLMVQIQSSWFPLYDRNPQTFVDNIAYAKPADFKPATHRVHHSATAASFIELPIRRGE